MIDKRDEVAALKSRGDIWRNWCLVCVAVILLRIMVLLGWLPPLASILWGR